MNIKRPEFTKEKHLEYLDDLRISGVTNMFGAVPYLVNEFSIKESEAVKTLSYWIETSVDRKEHKQ